MPLNGTLPGIREAPHGCILRVPPRRRSAGDDRNGSSTAEGSARNEVAERRESPGRLPERQEHVGGSTSCPHRPSARLAPAPVSMRRRPCRAGPLPASTQSASAPCGRARRGSVCTVGAAVILPASLWRLVRERPDPFVVEEPLERRVSPCSHRLPRTPKRIWSAPPRWIAGRCRLSRTKAQSGRDHGSCPDEADIPRRGGDAPASEVRRARYRQSSWTARSPAASGREPGLARSSARSPDAQKRVIQEQILP